MKRPEAASTLLVWDRPFRFSQSSVAVVLYKMKKYKQFSSLVRWWPLWQIHSFYIIILKYAGSKYTPGNSFSLTLKNVC